MSHVADCQVRKYRASASLQQVIIGSVIIALFDQQPLFFRAALRGTLLAPGADQCVGAAQLETRHLKVHFAAAHRIRGIATRRADYLVLAAVPYNHCACAIITVWNDPFEITILDRMVLNHHCQPALARIE
jgi:hypothetical protein